MRNLYVHGQIIIHAQRAFLWANGRDPFPNTESVYGLLNLQNPCAKGAYYAN